MMSGSSPNTPPGGSAAPSSPPTSPHTSIPPLRVVAAEDSHRDGLIGLIKPIFEEYDGVYFLLDEMPELNAIATSFNSWGGAFWCVFRGERLVGCAGWLPTAGNRSGAELRKLYVAKSERESGLGRRLLTLVEEAASNAGCTFLELWSDVKFVTAHRFYQRRGYERGDTTRELDDASATREFYFRKPL